jgi:hypothetical protein
MQIGELKGRRGGLYQSRPGTNPYLPHLAVAFRLGYILDGAFHQCIQTGSQPKAGAETAGGSQMLAARSYRAPCDVERSLLSASMLAAYIMDRICALSNAPFLAWYC